MNPNNDPDYICAISGRSPKEADLVLDAAADDDLDMLPVGWVRVTVERRGVNPAWVRILGAKARTLLNLMGQVPDDASDDAKTIMQDDMTTLVDAQFFAIESATPHYQTETVVLIVRNPDEDKGVAEAWGKVAEVLGFPASVVED